MIHPTAVIHPGAQVDSSCEIGPYAVIDEHVMLGSNCRVAPQVYLTGHTTIGSHNAFHAGCVIGDAPQDLKYRDEPTRLRIGDHNVFREHVTVHRSNKEAEDTVVGSHNFFMQHSHVAHNCLIGDHTIIAGGALLAGHATVQDRAFISGNCLVHQFVRVGALAMMQGGAAISKDLPPYTVARGHNGMSGLNTVGLRRAGFPVEARLELKRIYHLIFRGRRRFSEGLADAEAQAQQEPSRIFLRFVKSGKRGFCSDSTSSTQAPEEE